MTAGAPRRRVRVWFGPHQIADYTGTPPHAARYEAAMRRRFPALGVTNEAVPAPEHDGFPTWADGRTDDPETG